MRLLVVMFLLVPVTASEATKPDRTPPRHVSSLRCEIVEHGIYVPVTSSVTHPAPGTVTGTWTQTRVVRFVERTRTIPRQLERAFGFRYRVHGVPRDRAIRVGGRTTFPQKLQGKLVSAFAWEDAAPDGELVGHIGYHFDHDWELVAGTWTIALVVDGERVCSMQFQVT